MQAYWIRECICGRDDIVDWDLWMSNTTLLASVDVDADLRRVARAESQIRGIFFSIQISEAVPTNFGDPIENKSS